MCDVRISKLKYTYIHKEFEIIFKTERVIHKSALFSHYLHRSVIYDRFSEVYCGYSWRGLVKAYDYVTTKSVNEKCPVKV